MPLPERWEKCLQTYNGPESRILYRSRKITGYCPDSTINGRERRKNVKVFSVEEI
jgi:hypothetical protein